MTKTIEEFWTENPVGTNFIDGGVDLNFFEEYDNFRYSTEGHILKELDLIDFREKKVLEIGTGQGSDAMQIVKRGGKYHGIDLTRESIERVKKRFDAYNLDYEDLTVADATSLPYEDNSFDIVYSHGVIHHSPAIKQISSEIHRVLRPSGKAIIMLYNRNSFNYQVSIKILRRIGLLMSYYIPAFRKIISRATGEDQDRLNKHYDNFRNDGISYLRMSHFIHKSTDGPDNVFSSVWSRKSSKTLFKRFHRVHFKVNFLNERHLLGLQYVIPRGLKKKLSGLWGWHLWVFAEK